jgi:hypothetical protein
VEAADVALVAGAILGPAVAITAILAGEYRSRRERETTLSLTKAQHERERLVRHGDRYFEKRTELYDTLIRFLILASNHIVRTEPLIDAGQWPEVGWEATWEQLTTMQVQLKLYGSQEVEDAFERFVDRQTGFFGSVDQLRIAREGESDTVALRTAVDERRREALGSALDVQNLIRDELASL